MLKQLLGVLCIVLLAETVWAEVPRSPSTAQISRHGGVLVVQENATVKDGSISFVLPSGAKNIRSWVDGAAILRIERSPVVYQAMSKRIQRSREIQRRLLEINIQRQVIQERLELWKTLSEKMTIDDREAIDGKLLTLLPQLIREDKLLSKEEQLLLQSKERVEKEDFIGTKVTLTLDETKEQTLPLKYSYTLDDCGWEAHYVFSIIPEKSDAVHVDFMADVWQNTGFDWKNTEITIVTGKKGERVAPNVARWVIEEEEQEKVMRYKASQNEDMAFDVAPRAAAPAMRVVEDTRGVFAKWVLPEKNLVEGRQRVLIKEKTLKAPLQWLARPSKSKGDVYLMAEYSIPAGEVWPEGAAVYMVSGQNMGEGPFRSEQGAMKLYFGKDSRVSLEVLQDKQKRGESGFFGRDKNWSGAWTYVLKN
ncbi:MAG: DUF4139 domain-containing protein, partial [Desulfovibrio sp.]|nr:DUF4139 domain-containing protein [Desulfovibrio sp.]